MAEESVYVILGSEKGLAKQCLSYILETYLSLTFAAKLALCAGPVLTQALLHIANPRGGQYRTHVSHIETVR